MPSTSAVAALLGASLALLPYGSTKGATFARLRRRRQPLERLRKETFFCVGCVLHFFYCCNSSRNMSELLPIFRWVRQIQPQHIRFFHMSELIWEQIQNLKPRVHYPSDSGNVTSESALRFKHACLQIPVLLHLVSAFIPGVDVETKRIHAEWTCFGSTCRTVLGADASLQRGLGGWLRGGWLRCMASDVTGSRCTRFAAGRWCQAGSFRRSGDRPLWEPWIQVLGRLGCCCLCIFMLPPVPKCAATKEWCC